MTSIDIVQAIILISCSIAVSRICSRESTFCSRMTFFIMRAPMPPMFIRDSPASLGVLGSILPNIFCRADFSSVEAAPDLRSALRPQNVKNIVTSSPMAAAPLAMTNAASILSRSPLKTMIVFLVVSTVWFPSASGQPTGTGTGPSAESDSENSRMWLTKGSAHTEQMAAIFSRCGSKPFSFMSS